MHKTPPQTTKPINQGRQVYIYSRTNQIVVVDSGKKLAASPFFPLGEFRECWYSKNVQGFSYFLHIIWVGHDSRGKRQSCTIITNIIFIVSSREKPPQQRRLMIGH